MIVGSVCSGIGAPEVAWAPLGWKFAWCSEIEDFPSRVLAHRFPDVPNLGDMTTIAARVLAREVVAPDVLVGGTPCQGFSVAGLRGSLSDDRSNLALAFVKLANVIDQVRREDGREPCTILWENVPGVLSVKDNAFGCFLAGLVGADDAIVLNGKWSRAGVVAGPEGPQSRVAAWRTLDAQFFGVAQRRRRVFVLARGGAGAWSVANALLPLGEVFKRDPPTRGSTRPSSSSGPDAGPAVSGIAGPLGCHASRGWDPEDFERNGALIPSRSPRAGDVVEAGIPDVAWCLLERDAKGADSDTKPGHLIPCHPLASAGHAPVVAFSSKDYGSDAGEIAPTLRAGHHDKSHANGGVMPAVAFQQPMSVRRLTVRECERLQAFPDDWTLIPNAGPKKAKLEEDYIKYLMRPVNGRRRTREECFGLAADGPRYRALGNSMCVFVMRWIGRRIDAVLKPATVVEAPELET